MAKRPVFIPHKEGPPFVSEIMVDFEWFPGFSLPQKQRSIASLHKTAAVSFGLSPVLEISSKSPSTTGKALSAFNLMLDDPILGDLTSVEAAFQGSKVFEHGGPYSDLYEKTAREARGDARLKESGDLLCFHFGEARWPLEPKTAFYDWLYLHALGQQLHLAERLLDYVGFTDIEFNPKRSVNCQARSAAMFVSLTVHELLDDALQTPKSYLQIVSEPQDP